MEETYFQHGTFTSDGALESINLGFLPSKVRVFNLTKGTELNWNSDMAAASAKLSFETKAAAILSPAGCAIGTTKDYVANGAFSFMIAGAKYGKAAVAAGTGTATTEIPEGKWGLFGFEIGADGTIHGRDAAGNATGYATEALAIAAKPAASDAAHVLFMYVTVMKSDGAFTGNTTEFDAAGVTAHFYDVPVTASLTSGGVSTVDDGLTRGFSIGVDGSVNISGDTVYWEAFR